MGIIVTSRVNLNAGAEAVDRSDAGGIALDAMYGARPS